MPHQQFSQQQQQQRQQQSTSSGSTSSSSGSTSLGSSGGSSWAAAPAGSRDKVAWDNNPPTGGLGQVAWDWWPGTGGLGLVAWDLWPGTGGLGLVAWDWWPGTGGTVMMSVPGTGGLGLVAWDRWPGTGGLGLVAWDWWPGTGGLGLVAWDWWPGTGGQLGLVAWDRWQAFAYSGAVILLSVLSTGLNVQISYARRDFSTALSSKDIAGFHAACYHFVALIVFACPFFATATFIEERLVLAWRIQLTRHMLSAYFARRAYFHIKQPGDGEPIDNPDQRICDDVNAFVRASVTIVLSLFRKVFNCIAFAGVLWGVSSSLVLFLVTYATIGT
ncbi:MAG: hypothetical protein WDW38_004254 [Sanguina aurantia]